MISRNRVVAWWLDVESATHTDREHLLSLLSQDERSRAERFRFDQDRLSYVAAHALCRSLLTYCLGEPPASWQFSVSHHGKPELMSPADGPRYRINLSHARGMAAAALTVEHNIGVDVEWLLRNISVDNLSKRILSEREQSVLDSAPAEQRNELFMHFWTLKESYVKAIGMGISQSLNAFSFDLERLVIHFGDKLTDNTDHWHFERYSPGPEHLMALAINHPTPENLVIDAGPAPLDYLLQLATRT
jgi:4'-phosphopantetheinyl transferase